MGVRKTEFRAGCDVAGCPKPHYGKGFCRKHWERNKKNGSPTVVKTTHHLSLKERLVMHGEWNGECFEWKRHLDRYGYGQITVNGKVCTVHRVAFHLAHGDIPAGLVVRHSCDNRKCYNLAHLELGTHAENQNDKVMRRRSAYGQKNGSAKLTDEKVRKILYMDRHGVSTANICGEFGVGRSTVRRIVRGESWRHVTG